MDLNKENPADNVAIQLLRCCALVFPHCAFSTYPAPLCGLGRSGLVIERHKPGTMIMRPPEYAVEGEDGQDAGSRPNLHVFLLIS